MTLGEAGAPTVWAWPLLHLRSPPPACSGGPGVWKVRRDLVWWASRTQAFWWPVPPSLAQVLGRSSGAGAGHVPQHPIAQRHHSAVHHPWHHQWQRGALQPRARVGVLPFGVDPRAIWDSNQTTNQNQVLPPLPALCGQNQVLAPLPALLWPELGADTAACPLVARTRCCPRCLPSRNKNRVPAPLPAKAPQAFLAWALGPAPPQGCSGRKCPGLCP